MTASLVTTDQADAHIRAITRWWRANRPAAPYLFEDEVDRAFELLVTTPLMGEVYKRRRADHIRRVLLSASHYFLYYTFDDIRKEVQVVAVWSAHRGRGPKLG